MCCWGDYADDGGEGELSERMFSKQRMCTGLKARKWWFFTATDWERYCYTGNQPVLA